ncbi:MAG: choice-of-anchor Q domain-containing protein, partial [Dokdonella sp.]
MTISRLPLARRPRLRLHPLAACLASSLLLQGAAFAAGAPAARGSLVVQNCDDAGAGSLRDTVAAAVDGAVVDLSALTCGSIALSSGAIAIPADVASLSLTGPGEQALSISGSDSSRVFEQQGSGTLTLSGLTLTHGLGADNGGCVLANGSVTLSNVTVVACAAGSAVVANTSGGGVFVLGNAILDHTTFANNTVDGNVRVRGGAIAAGGSFTSTSDSFTGNRASSHDVGGGTSFTNIAEGGAIHALGDTDLTDSVVSGNTAESESYEVFGGGIAVGSHPDDAYASLDIQRGTITGNTVVSECDVCAPQGGGIAVVGITRLRNTTLGGNSVGSTNHYGGGGGMRVFDGISVEIDDSIIAGNHADSAGGGLITAEEGYLYLDGTTISDNDAGNTAGTNEGGGGVLCFGCALQLSSSTVSGNTAGSVGGGIAVRYGEYAPSPAAIIDSTISGNNGYEGGGLMLDGGNAQISNSTIAFNQASFRGAGISASEYSYSIDLQSTIVANNTTGSDANNVWAFPDSISGADNLVPNAPGLPAEMPPDTLTADPLLLPLADNGGATQTHALGGASPAIDAGNDAIGLVFDQRGDGFLREVGASADIGAFETQSAQPQTYTIGGSVSGLIGSGLVLQQNGGDDLAIAADGSFTFSSAVNDGSIYIVTVLVQPSEPAQTCVVSNDSGAVLGADVTDVAVACTTDITDRIFADGFDAAD